MDNNILSLIMEEMEEEKKTLIAPIDNEEFKKKVHEMAIANQAQLWDDFNHGILHLRNFEGVKRFKSIRRAIRRGHVSIFGDVYPKRPFNNKKRGPGSLTYEKRRIYEQLRRKAV